jgi:hypothetical protein
VDLSGPAGEHFEGTSAVTSDTTASSSVAWASAAWDPGSWCVWGRVIAWELSLADGLQSAFGVILFQTAFFFFLFGTRATEGNSGVHGEAALHDTSVDALGTDLAAGAIGIIGVGLTVPSVGDRDHAVVGTTDQTATSTAGAAPGNWDTAIVGAHVSGHARSGGAVGSAGESAVATRADAISDLTGPAGEHLEGSALCACDVTTTSSVAWASCIYGIRQRCEIASSAVARRSNG